MKALRAFLAAVVIAMCFSSCEKELYNHDGNKAIEISVDGTSFVFVLLDNHEVKVSYSDFNGINSYYSGHVAIPDSITYKKEVYCVVGIDGDAFRDCRDLHWVRIPNTITYIGDGAFECCENLTTIEIPNSVTCLPNYVFKGCGFSSFDIPSSITTIGREAFSDCYHLKTVIIPESVESLEHTFNSCRELSSVTCLAPTPPLFNNDVFQDCPILEIKVPAESVDSYKSAEGWKNYADKIVGI